MRFKGRPAIEEASIDGIFESPGFCGAPPRLEILLRDRWAPRACLVAWLSLPWPSRGRREARSDGSPRAPPGAPQTYGACGWPLVEPSVCLGFARSLRGKVQFAWSNLRLHCMQMKILSCGGFLSALRVLSGLMGGGMGRIPHFGGDRAEESALMVWWKALGPPAAPQAFWSQWAPFGGGKGAANLPWRDTCARGSQRHPLHLSAVPPPPSRASHF